MKCNFPGSRYIFVSERHRDSFPFASCGEKIPWQLLMWPYDQGPLGVIWEWLPGTCRLSCAAMPVTFTAARAPCSGTLSEPRPRVQLPWFAQRLRTCSWVLSSTHALHCAAFIHCGHLALLGELFLRYLWE